MFPAGAPEPPPSQLRAQPVSCPSGSRIPAAGRHRQLGPGPAQRSSQMRHTPGGPNEDSGGHFITSPEAPLLPATANKAPGPHCQVGELRVRLTHDGARFEGLSGGSRPSANQRTKVLLLKERADHASELLASFPQCAFQQFTLSNVLFWSIGTRA